MTAGDGRASLPREGRLRPLPRGPDRDLLRPAGYNFDGVVNDLEPAARQQHQQQTDARTESG